MTSEEEAAIRSRKGKEPAEKVARRYDVPVNTVKGLWKGASANGRPKTLVVPGTAKGRIQKRLRETGHTYASIGAVIGITPQAVSEIVNGRTTGATARYALSRALDRWPEDFWWDDPDA